MNEVIVLAVTGFAIWLAGFGAAMIVQQHGRYVAITRRGVRLIFRQFGRLVSWAWRRWHTQIIWAVIGAAVTLYLLLGYVQC